MPDPRSALHWRVRTPTESGLDMQELEQEKNRPLEKSKITKTMSVSVNDVVGEGFLKFPGSNSM
jgi:hypothetical protein